VEEPKAKISSDRKLFFFQYDLHTNAKALTTLREMLLLVRLWGATSANCQPYFTKTAESFDLVAKLFEIVTKQGNKPSDEALHGRRRKLPGALFTKVNSGC
jgi:hypothetical protein